MENLKLRLERENDCREVEMLTREAFWNVHVPGCDEHFILHNIRNSEDFIPELDFVAEVEGRILGHIVYTHGVIENDNGEKYKVICFGPISVHPDFQKRGIGSELVRYSLNKAKDMGFEAVCIYGDPRYYSRFGFRCGERYNIKTSDGMYAVALMALELKPGALQGIKGRFVESSSFEAEKEEFDIFESTFPHKEKKETYSQTEFKILSSLRYK